MKEEIRLFLTSFSWYRKLTKKMLEEIPFEYFNQSLSSRSLTLSCQFIDMGDMQLRVIESLTGKKTGHILRPTDNVATKEEIVSYIDACNDHFEKEIAMVSHDARMDWFGRMDFDLKGTLDFLLAHEAMHHGEILSFIFSKNIQMPPSLKDTWGFER